jgi:hypothetical protein
MKTIWNALTWKKAVFTTAFIAASITVDQTEHLK